MRSEHLLVDDVRVTHRPIIDVGEALTPVPSGLVAPGHPTPVVRTGLIPRLNEAARFLQTRGLDLRVVEGWRSPQRQSEIFSATRAALQNVSPHLQDDDLDRQTAMFVSPARPDAPHATGGAVDVVLWRIGTGEADMGSAFDVSIHDSNGLAATAAAVGKAARANRNALISAMTRVGFINYPYEWWHWSFGDQYWAVINQIPHALYGGCVHHSFEDPSQIQPLAAIQRTTITPTRRATVDVHPGGVTSGE